MAGCRRSACSARASRRARRSSPTRRHSGGAAGTKRWAAPARYAPSATASASSIRPPWTSAPTGWSASSTSSATVEHIRDLKLNALTDDRKLSFAGGVAILAEVFEQLGIESMRVADGAMREGLLYDLLGRYTDEDARERTVRSMQERYHVDLAQAERVENTAVDVPGAGGGSWQLADPAIELLAALGGAPARDRPRRGAQRLPPPRRLSTGERRHGRLPARRAETAGHHGRQPPPQAGDRRSRTSSRRPGTSARRR